MREEGEKEEKRKREKKRKRERRRREAKLQKGMELCIFVWKLTLIMDSKRLCMNCHAWLVSSLSPNLGFC